jgi:hypothetical protein
MFEIHHGPSGLREQGVLTLRSTLLSLRGSKTGTTSNVGTTGTSTQHMPDIHSALNLILTTKVITSSQPAETFSAITVFQ